ncbi:hypothetical protein ONP19_21165, partial [Salmonella enterica subsp. enterica serovar Muenster]|nr:hypothetical protein [Salmonella enterica subsp. enterica serovar Muenster]
SLSHYGYFTCHFGPGQCSPKRVSVLNAASGGPKGERSESNLTYYVYAPVFARCLCSNWLRQ